MIFLCVFARNPLKLILKKIKISDYSRFGGMVAKLGRTSHNDFFERSKLWQGSLAVSTPSEK
ncbi:MAG: hypothetical protein LBQ50_02250, partial [Planctomycetaceae bacterium]|nr:hypothetical protein [Planctomycetaceae bacterium]